MNMSRGKKTRKKERELRRRGETTASEAAEGVSAAAGPGPIEGPGPSAASSCSLASVFSAEEIHELRDASGTDVNDIPVLFAAVVLGKFETVKKLIKENYAVDCLGPERQTPLHWAVRHHQTEMVEVLVRRGANPTLEDANGDHAALLALQTAAWDEEAFMALWRTLRENHVFDLNHSNQAGYTMLHYATKNQWSSWMSWLLAQGVHVDCATRRRVTPLMMAASRNHSAVARKLLQAGADPALEDERNCTALCYAIAFVMQKRLPLPNATVDALLQSTSLDRYLKRRLDLLCQPSPSVAEACRSVFLSVLSYAVRHTQQGLSILLGLQVFARLAEATSRNLMDVDYASALLLVMGDLLRYCECCYGHSHVSEDELMTLFVRQGGATICLDVLKQHGASQEHKWLLLAALLPLLLACPSPGVARYWLQTHVKDLEPFYGGFGAMCIVSFGHHADETHAELAHKRVALFRELWAALHRGERIAATPSPPPSLPPPPAQPQQPPPRRKATRSLTVRACSSQGDTDADAAGDSRRRSRSSDSRWTSHNRVWVSERILKDIRPKDDDAKNDDAKNDADEAGHEEEEPSPSTPVSLTGCDEDLERLDSLFRDVIRQYERKWERERRLGYPGHRGDVLPHLREVLPRLEREHLRRLSASWRSVVARMRASQDGEARRVAANHLHVLLLSYHDATEKKLRALPSPGKRANKHQGAKVNLDKCIAEYIAGTSASIVGSVDADVKTPADNVVALKQQRTPGVVVVQTRNQSGEDSKQQHPGPAPPPGFPAQVMPLPDPYVIVNITDAAPSQPVGIKVVFPRRCSSRWKPLVAALASLPSSQSVVVAETGVKLSGGVTRPRFRLADGVELGLRGTAPLAIKRLSCAALTLLQPLASLRHAHVLPYAAYSRLGAELLVATPLCECNLGELLMSLKMAGRLDACAHALSRQLLAGLHFLHSRPVVHGNLKPSNVLLDDAGVLKLADFGVHQFLYQGKQPPSSSVIWWARETCQAYQCNSCQLLCSSRTDIQVAGMLLHFIFTGGAHPFGTDAAQILDNVNKGKTFLKTSNCELNDLIEWMLMFDPQDRPTITDVFRHVFFWDTEKKWRFLLACAGKTPEGRSLPFPLPDFHAYLDKKAIQLQIKGDWVSLVQSGLPELAPPDNMYTRTPSGLLRFMKACIEKQNHGACSLPLQHFFTSAFPYLPLTLHRLIEDSDWLTHPALVPFLRD